LEQAVGIARSHGIPEIGLHQSELDAGVAETVRQAGLSLGVWGANHEPTIFRAMRLGAQIITTDDPPLAVALASRAMVPERRVPD
jgi:glycerophosphoryl diester phosphodiesterase